MEQWADLGAGERVRIEVRRRSNARRLSLRVSQTDGRVSLSAPKWVSAREITQFLDQHRDWLGTALTGVADREVVGIGTVLPLEGQEVEIVPSETRRGVRRVDPHHLAVAGPPEAVGGRVRGHLKALARDRLSAASSRYADMLGRTYTRLTLRDTRSRWGSCSSSGGLMYSWRLIMAPGDVLDYVAAHEVAHLVEMNHSRAFWATVEGLMPGFEAPRLWLKENGRHLHRWQFDQ